MLPCQRVTAIVGKPVGLCQGIMAIFSLNCSDLRQYGAVTGAKRALPQGHLHTVRFLQLKVQTLTKLKRYDETEPALPARSPNSWMAALSGSQVSGATPASA